jgi:hypothetical protein
MMKLNTGLKKRRKKNPERISQFLTNLTLKNVIKKYQFKRNSK